MGKPNVHHVNLWDVVRSALTASLPMPDTWKTALRRQRVIYTRPANYLATSPWGVGIIFSIIEKTTGWWYTYPSEKYELTYESVWMMTFPIYGKSEKIHGSSHHQSENEAFKTARILEVKQLGILQHHCLRSLSNYSSLWIAQGGAIWLLNSLPWKDSPRLRTVNHHKPSISMGHAISHGKLSAITRWYQ